MMKKFLTLLIVGIAAIFMAQTFAYTPTQDLNDKLDVVVERIEDIIDTKGERMRITIVGLLNRYLDKNEGNDRVEYMIRYLLEALENDNMEGIDDAGSLGSDHSEMGLVESDYLGDYTIRDSNHGTEMTVTINGETRTIMTNALPNHETGEFPNSGNPNAISAQSVTYQIPTKGEYLGNEERAQIPGIAVNGVKFEPETAERLECNSGEIYKIEAIQELADLGLDDNNAHVQPTGEYHYHGTPHGLVDQFEEDLVHVGFALDGFLIYYSKKGTYTSSYRLSTQKRMGTSCSYRGDTIIVDGTSPDGTYVSDRDYVSGLGDLDACNGTYIDGQYVYIVTDEYPYIGRCLNGDYTQTGSNGGGGNGGRDTRMPPPKRY